MMLAARNGRTHSATFVRTIILKMRRSVFFLGLSPLCGAFASVDGHWRPAQGRFVRPPDAASADDGFFNLPSSHLSIRVVFFVVPDAEAAPSAPPEQSSDCNPRNHVRDGMPHVSCRRLHTRVLTVSFSACRRRTGSSLHCSPTRLVREGRQVRLFLPPCRRPFTWPLMRGRFQVCLDKTGQRTVCHTGRQNVARRRRPPQGSGQRFADHCQLYSRRRRRCCFFRRDGCHQAIIACHYSVAADRRHPRRRPLWQRRLPSPEGEDKIHIPPKEHLPLSRAVRSVFARWRI